MAAARPFWVTECEGVHPIYLVGSLSTSAFRDEGLKSGSMAILRSYVQRSKTMIVNSVNISALGDEETDSNDFI